MARWAASLKEKLWSFDSCLRLHQWARWVTDKEEWRGWNCWRCSKDYLSEITWWCMMGCSAISWADERWDCYFQLQKSWLSSTFCAGPIIKSCITTTLKAFEMNKLDGRKQCIQCDTIILMTNPEPSVCGLPQKITLANSQPKGLQTILTKHGFKVNKLWAKCSPVCPFKSQNYCMAQILSQQDNFINQESMIESLIKKEGHLVVFLPKFHCELNAIEMVSLDLQL